MRSRYGLHNHLLATCSSRFQPLLCVQNDFYEALYTQSKAKFGAYVNSGTLLNNYAHIFDLLTRLRQAVDHPYLILYGAGEKPAFEDGSASATQVSDVCGICRESVEDPVLTGCRHLFCRLCMHEYLESVGGRATSLLKDQTNDQSAYVGEDSGDETATPKKGAAAKKKARASAAAASPGEDGGLAPKCPTCFADLTVDLTAQSNPQVLSGTYTSTTQNTSTT
jgi:SNF2 family DNA or RNA helicase